MNTMEILKSIRHHLSHYAKFPVLLREIALACREGSGQGGKSVFSIVVDHLYLFFVLKVLPVNYSLFQFGFKNREVFREYMDAPVAPLLKHRLYETLWDSCYGSLVNDKYLFDSLCRYHEIPVPEVPGACSGEVLRGDTAGLAEMMDRRGFDRVILKPLKGVQGKGIYLASRGPGGIEIRPAGPEETFDNIKNVIKDGFIVQKVVDQHPRLNEINPHCLNTIRLITFLTRDNEVEFLAAMLRTSPSRMAIDNFSAGGIVIGIDLETGRLKGPGFQATRTIEKIDRHPLTGTVFQGFQVPCWREVRETASRAQKVFNQLKSIAWDMGVAPDGPVVIEGNIEWGTAGIQATNGGLLTPKIRSLFAQYGLTFYEQRQTNGRLRKKGMIPAC